MSDTTQEDDVDPETESIYKSLTAAKMLTTFESITALPDGHVRLRLFGQAGQNHILQATTNFLDWRDLRSGVDVNDEFDFEDIAAPEFRQRFYRAVIEP